MLGGSCSPDSFSFGIPNPPDKVFSRISMRNSRDHMTDTRDIQMEDKQGHKFLDEEAMHLVYAVCGKDVKLEFLTSLTSFYLFAISSLLHSPLYYHIHVVSDGLVVKQDLAFLRPSAHFKASIHPPYSHSVELFKLCSTERIYLHEHEDFRNMDKVIYVDADTLWMDFPSVLQLHFADMEKKSAHFGLAEETYSGGSWYTIDWAPPEKNLSIPFYGERGLNAGLLVVSLAAVRTSNFSAERDAVIAQYGPLGLLEMGDQDVLNIIAHKHPYNFHVLPCSVNVRSDARCPPGLPVLIHGNRSIMKDPATTFNHLYTFFAMMSRAINSPTVAEVLREVVHEMSRSI
ncbi:hypothetical protein WJX75_003496 [Coccomyxa subellipsoidea]|uniref:Hexosyltransferase n=1 Tax=Coccomyxa subellipsoidea TaxID=248742 RepID=A0ABR2Z324_9CHLO